MLKGIISLAISQASFGITNSLWKKPQSKIGILPLIVTRSFFTSILFGVAVLIQNKFSSLTLEMAGNSVLLCFINFFGFYFFLRAIKEKQVSEVIGLNKVSVLFGILIGYFYYKENINQYGFITVLLIALSVICIEFLKKKKSVKISKGFVFALLSTIFWSTDFLFKDSIKEIGALLFSFILEVSVFSIGFVLMKLQKEKLNISVLLSYKKTFLILIILGFTGVLGTIYSIQSLPIIVFALLNLVYPLTSYLFAGFYLKERLTGTQWVGVVLGIVGSLIYTIFK
ncbi:DMT family transporter [Weeksellaceae bacterium TAE3-ERU29]|nr:DMT family transporter [Weeksellaceae bacterium TAE3-ERU29]